MTHDPYDEMLDRILDTDRLLRDLLRGQYTAPGEWDDDPLDFHFWVPGKPDEDDDA